MGILERTHYLLKCDGDGCNARKGIIVKEKRDLSASLGDWTVNVEMVRGNGVLPGTPVVRSVFCPKHSGSND